MNSSMTNQLVSQVLMQSPAWLVMIVALVYWSRYPRPALLTLIASVLLLTITFGYPFLQNYLFQTVRMSSTPVAFNQTMLVVGLLFNLVRGVAYSLFLWAVFAARSDAAPGYAYPVASTYQPPPTLR